MSVKELLLLGSLVLSACLSSPPGSADDDGGPPGDADPTRPDARGETDSGNAEHLGGNVLFFPFNEPDPARNYATGEDAEVIDPLGALFEQSGVYGLALAPYSDDSTQAGLLLDDLLDEANPPLTVEAWIRLNALGFCQTMLSDNGEYAPELGFEIGGANHPRLESNDGGSKVSRTAEEITLDTENWHHIAMTWDGSLLSTFHNGNPVAMEEYAINLATRSSSFAVGTRPDLACGFRGRIDELKLSDYVKTTEQIQESMNFNSTTLPVPELR